MLNRKQVPVKKQPAGRAPVRREPDGHPFADLQREINRMFDDVFSGFGLLPAARTAGRAFLPRLNVSESGKEISLTAELPGLTEQDVEISVSRGRLSLRGEKKAEQEEKGRQYYCLERTWGAFQRDIPIPEDVDVDAVQAAFRNGVLRVTLPRKPGAQEARRKIPIRTA